MKTSQQQSSPNQQIPQCIFCTQQQQNQQITLFYMMNQALITKHSNPINHYFISPINIILKIQQPHTISQIYHYITYQQFTYLDQIHQQLRRFYKINEWESKIKSIIQYYKYHQDIPHVISNSIQKIMDKYYGKKKQYNYKNIKKILKQQQGLSISSIQQSLIDNTCTIIQKSKYSNILNTLKLQSSSIQSQNYLNINPQISDSNILENMCSDIDKKLSKITVSDNDFKGSFNPENKNFEKYIKSIQKKTSQIYKLNSIQQHFNNKINIHPTNNPYYNFHQINNKNNPFSIKTKTLTKQIKQYQYYQNNNKQPLTSIFKQYNQPIHKQFKYQKSVTLQKINTINSLKYQQIIGKIYQPHSPQILLKFPNKFDKFKSDKIKCKSEKKISQSHKNNHVKDTFNDKLMHKYQLKQIQGIKWSQKNQYNRLSKQTMSQQNLRRNKQQPLPNPHPSNPNFFNKRINIRTITTIKLKSQLNHRQKNLIHAHPISLRQSITLNKNKQYEQKIPFTKYSSSSINKQKLKGISIKDVLLKKLDTFQK